MSLILEYAGGGSPPTADILYSTSSTDPGNNTCGLPSPPSQSISSLSSSSAEDCDGLGLLSSSSSQTTSALLNNSSSSGYTSPFASDEIVSPSNHLPCGGSSSASSTSHWHHVRHDRGDLFLPPFSGSPSPGAEDGAFLLDSYMESGGEGGGDMMALSSSSSSSSLGNHHHRLAGKASRRRRRSPPSVTKFDINDNSLHSVYAFVKSFLSASTASTVAIDNKIEQAMDLVKSHLMFAVREEVDVLKERIGELMERINHLEYENTVLRKYATQEALQQIQQQHGGAPNP